MFKKLSNAEKKSIITKIKINSAIVQATFIAFPLSMYVVYNKIIVNHNPNSLIIIVLFLVFIALAQIIFKTFSTIYENILKANYEINNCQELLKYKINKNNNKTILHESGFTKIETKSNENIQQHLTSSSKILLIIYFILMISIGGVLAIIPAIFFTINYRLALKTAKQYNNVNEKHLEALAEKNSLIKDIFINIKNIKGLNLTNKILNQYEDINNKYFLYKTHALYIKNILVKKSMSINILNIAFILILGRFLYSMGMLSIYHIVTCSLLTVWVSRSLAQMFVNLNIEPDNDNKKLFNPRDDFASTNNNSANFNLTNATKEHANKLIKELNSSNIVFCDVNKSKLDLKSLAPYLKEQNLKVSYISNNFKLFYGSITNNITLFDQVINKEALDLLSKFNVDHIIAKLPYQHNYIITGKHDTAITFDLMLSIILTRELICNPDVIILDINIDEININIKKALLDYAKDHYIQLIVKSSGIDFHNLEIDNKFNKNLNKIDDDSNNITLNKANEQ